MIKHRFRIIPAMAIAIFAIACASLFAADETSRRSYDIPAGEALAALKQFAAQAGVQLLYSTPELGGVRTEAVRGSYTPQEALERMLAETGLIASRDPRTGAIAVRRADAEKNGGSRPGARSAEVSGRAIQLETYEVTSTRDTGIVNQGVIARDPNQAVRYHVIARDAIDRSGANSLPDLLLRQLPQASNFGTGTQATFSAQLSLLDGINVPADRISLRGLGSNQTLVMVNGRRLYGSEELGPDLSRIPLSAVDRIEIQPSSGSAIYGANAMAGVINIVLRKNFSGGEASVYFGMAEGGAEELRISGFKGFNFNERTNLNISAEYKKISPLTLAERGYHLRALQRITPATATVYASQIVNAFVGPRPNIARSPANAGLGIPSNLTTPFAAVPIGSNGIGLTPSSFNDTAGQPVISTSRLDGANLVGPNESAAVFGTLEHEFRGGRLAGYAEASFRWADNSAGDFVDLLPVMTLSATHPLNPFRTQPGFTGRAINVAVNPIDVPQANMQSVQRSYRFVGGLKGKLDVWGDRTFNWSADASWDRNETKATTVRYTTQLRIAAAHGLYNPLRDLTGASMLPPDELAKLRSSLTNLTHPEITATNWRANGEVFEAWGGDVAVSFGAEFRYEYQYDARRFEYGAYADLAPANGAVPSKQESERMETNRRSYAGYMEVVVPIVGERNRMPVLHSLDLSAAARYEKYDDFDAANPPMVAVKLAPTPDFALRAQYSEGFQPPTQFELFSGGIVVGPSPFFSSDYVDAQRPGLPNTDELVILAGIGNPNLRPETSETWDTGVILTPRFLPGLTINVAYFRYDKQDLTGSLSLQEYVDAGFFARGPNLPGDPAGVPGPIVEISEPYVNIARQFTDGYDLSVEYSFTTAVGRFLVTADATHTRRFQRQDQPGSVPVETVGDLGFGGGPPLKWRGKASLGWSRGPFTATWSARYFDSYLIQSNAPTPSNPFRSNLDGPNIPSSIEHDVQFSYAAPAGSSRGWRGWVEGTKFTIGAMNVLDREPPYLTNRGTLWYSTFNDPRQRFVYGEIRKFF